jgi:hypothetical protein
VAGAFGFEVLAAVVFFRAIGGAPEG